MDDSIDEQTRSLLGIVAVLRSALIIWAAVVVVIDITGTTSIHGAAAIAALAVLAAWSLLAAWAVRGRPDLVVSPAFVAVDVALATIAVALDSVIYPGPHPQSFASAWPLSAAVVAGLVFGARVGALAGLVIGGGGAVSVAVFATGGLDGRVLGVFGTIVLLCVAGALAGLVSERLREAELTRARAQIREEVARKLHDGVLQTLAVIQRRSNDDELVALARDQESELRSFITAPPAVSASNRDGSADAVWNSEVVDHLTGSLRTALRQQEKRYPIKCELVVVDEPERVADAVIAALTGAVSEAVTNAAKHGQAHTVTVFVDSEADRVMCEVADDGSGFDTSSTTEGIGLSRSVRGRIEEVGGSVEITSVIGRGTRVRLSVPL